MKVIIIEDEPLMAEALEEELLKADESIEILKKLGSIKEALNFLTPDNLPDLFFSDIQLPDGLSFEIFKTLQTTTPIIFCTAYDEYALDAFKANGIDYVLKPFESEDIVRTLGKYQNLVSQPDKQDYNQLLSILENSRSKAPSALLIYQGDKIIPIKATSVALAEVDHGIVYVRTVEGQRHAVNYNMDRLHELLGRDFYRLNRQYLIHRDTVKQVSQYFARKLLVVPSISVQEKLIVSKANATDFLRWLEAH